MRRLRLSTLLLGLIAVLALVAAGGGGDDDEEGGGGEQKTAPVEGKKGGEVTFLAAADVDYLDPGQTYYTFGYMVHYAVNRTLYSFEPDDAEKPVADIAEGEPQISDDQKTVTVKIKRGIKYAPPVNREVTTKDIKYAIERAFSAAVPSGYATAYYGDLVGAPDAPTKGVKPIEGIETPDDQTIVFKLDQPAGVTLAAALVMPITTPVPEEYAKEYDAKSPSTYDNYVAFTGPYMVKNDANGKVIGRDQGKRIEIVRNPNWDQKTDYRPAYLDAITIEEGNDDVPVSSRRTLQGSKLMCCDGELPASILKQSLTRYKDQTGRVPGGGSRWIALNTQLKPFDDVNVRRAVVAGFDRNALRLTRGGEEVGPIAQHYIPPGIPGHEESGGEKGFTEFDFMQKPEGDMALASEYFKKAGMTSGKYEGSEKLLTIATNAEPGLQTAQAAQGQFEKLGFKLNFRQVPQDTLYTKFCGVPDSKYIVCPNVGWFKDFTDPESMLEPTFKGSEIKEQGNVNWSQLDDKSIDDLMTKGSTVAGGEDRNKAWAEVNKKIVEQAVGIPYVWDDSFQIASKDVQGVVNGYYTSWDLSFSSLK